MPDGSATAAARYRRQDHVRVPAERLDPGRARFRDFDGRIRRVAKHGRSRAAAERALKLELANRQTPAGGGAIVASTRVSELARLWLDAPHGWSTGTERTYRSVIGNQVVPALGELRLREVTTGVVSRALRAIADRHGPSAAKSSKACLSGMFRMAIEDGALPANPVRDSPRGPASARSHRER